jgi:hypothetical protein
MIVTALLSGYSIATREEIIFFIVPLAISFLIVKKYHCIRYITPSYIAFNFVIVSLFQFLYEKYWEKISKHSLLNSHSI